MKSIRDAAKFQERSKIAGYKGSSTGSTFTDKGHWGDAAAPVDSSQENRKPEGASSSKPVHSARYGGAVGIGRYDRKPRAAGGRVAKAGGGKLPSVDETARSMARTGEAKVSESSKLPSPLEAVKSEQRLGNMRVTRKHGGKAHSDEVEDKALVKRMVKPECREKRADGGAVNGKKGTTVNIVIAGNPSAAGGEPPMPRSMPVVPPMPPQTPPMAPPVGPMMGPGGAGGIGAPPLLRKRGGRIRTPADLTAGALSGEGRLQKIELQKGK